MLISEGGTMEWDTTFLGNTRWFRGIYDFISAQDGVETKVKKNDNQIEFQVLGVSVFKPTPKT
jgi:hypothetical protein